MEEKVNAINNKRAVAPEVAEGNERKKGRWDSTPSVMSSIMTSSGSSASSAALIASQKAQERLRMLQQRQAMAGFVRPSMTSQPIVASAMSSAQLRAQLQQQSGYTGVVLTTPGSGLSPMKFDKLGRPLDDQGNVLQMINPFAHSSLRINQKLVMKSQRRQREKKLEKALEQAKNPINNEYYDSSLVSKKSSTNRGLAFHVSGTFAKKEASVNARKLGISLDELLPEALKQPSHSTDTAVSLKPTNLIPTVEPWDAELFHSHAITTGDGPLSVLPPLPDGARPYDFVCLNALRSMKDVPEELKDLNRWVDEALAVVMPKISSMINTKTVTLLEQHPIPIEPRGIKDRKHIDSKVYLTLRETKKLRRRRRKEVEGEKRDKIRIGVLAPPPPKVKLVNLHRVLAMDSVQDPTSVEASVRAQMKQRLADHEARNAARQLTDEQIRDKKVLGWRETKEQKKQVTVLLFSLPKTSRNIRYQISQNAEQLHLTGCMFHAEGLGRGICVVEGGPKSTRFFKRLMLRRIKWGGKNISDVIDKPSEYDDDDEDDIYGSAQKADVHNDSQLVQMNHFICDDKRPSLVWEGYVDESSGKKFTNWRSIDRPQSEAQIQTYFKNRDAVEYWQLVIKHRPTQVDLHQMND
eukprot:GHVH01010660.1.p1 GENE.GHVH01010660.1~~GHVH01010660.1.p1  ORF type:complete len:648 (+),score=112.46 GHVH01010660.1:38-1945(+)